MARKRNNGEGSITYDKIRDSYRVAVTAPDGRRIFKRCKTEQEAIVWKTEQLNAMHKGTFVAPSTITIGEWAIEWLTTYKKGALKQRTYEVYLSEAKHLKEIANIKLQDLRPVQVQKLYTFLMDGSHPLSAHTVHKVHKLLKDMLKKAQSLDMVQKNIMEQVSAPKFETKEIEIFSRAETNRILETCHNTKKYAKYYPIFLLLLTTGARKGEILGLRWMDVLFGSSEIFIRQNLQESVVIGPYLDTPKTKSSIRKISIPPEAVKVMKELKAGLQNVDIEQKRLCFLTGNGTPFRGCNLGEVWKHLLKDSGVPHKKLHTLRHTHATELLAASVPIIEVSRRLGHSKISHTLELYGHAIPNYDQKIAGTVQGLYCIP